LRSHSPAVTGHVRPGAQDRESLVGGCFWRGSRNGTPGKTALAASVSPKDSSGWQKTVTSGSAHEARRKRMSPRPAFGEMRFLEGPEHESFGTGGLPARSGFASATMHAKGEDSHAVSAISTSRIPSARPGKVEAIQ
jgi:hypothetical protein